MEILPLLCIVLAFTGLTRGAGVLPDGPLNAIVGGKVTFTPTPSENPFVTVSWRFGGRDIITFIAGNITDPEYEDRITLFMSTGSLELRNLKLNDSGDYSVTIAYPLEFPKEGTTTLNVYAPVSNVVVTSDAIELLEFSSVNLSCSASSGSSLSFLWLNGSSEVTASDRVQLTGGGSNLTIVNVTRYDQGPFRCRVSNPLSNSTSKPVNLSIYYGPENIDLTISPSQEYFEEGSNVNLSCSADSRPPAQLSWFLNGDELPHTEPVLKLVNIQENQTGSYSCQAFNNITMGNETSQASPVSVLEKISGASVTSSSINLLIEGNSVNLTCDAAGFVFTRQWMKDGSNLTLTDNIKLYDNGRVLSFNRLGKTDSGEYTCEISSPVSRVRAKYSMVVNYGPEHVTITGPSEIQSEQTLTLTCSAESTPSANYTWTLNGAEIHKSSVFTIKSTELSDSGNYACQAMNDITGRSSSAVHGLSVTAIPVNNTSGCSAGCIAGIVIACVVVIGAAAGGGYLIYKKKNPMKKYVSRSNNDRTGGGAPHNNAYADNQEVNYADVRFVKKNGGTVQMGLESETTEYSEVSINNAPTATSAPPPYDVHMERMKKAVSHLDADGSQVYAQVRKN